MKRRRKRTNPGSSRDRQRQEVLHVVKGLLEAAQELRNEVEWYIIGTAVEADALGTKSRLQGLKDALAQRVIAVNCLDQATELVSHNRCTRENLAQAVLDSMAYDGPTPRDRAITTKALKFLWKILNDNTARQVIASQDTTGSLSVEEVRSEQERSANLGAREDLMYIILAHLGVAPEEATG